MTFIDIDIVLVDTAYLEPATIAYPTDANGALVDGAEGRCATCPQSEHPYVPAHGYCLACFTRTMDEIAQDVGL